MHKQRMKVRVRVLHWPEQLIVSMLLKFDNNFLKDTVYVSFLYTIKSMQSLFQFMFTLVCVYISFWSLQNVEFEKIVLHSARRQILILRAFLAIVIGYFVANFFLTMGNLIISFSQSFQR
ncbi:DUF1146 domain-containing protein [Oenococcus kitaharae]